MPPGNGAISLGRLHAGSGSNDVKPARVIDDVKLEVPDPSQPFLNRAAVTAIQEQHDLVAVGTLNQVTKVTGGDGGSAQCALVCVSGGQAEMAIAGQLAMSRIVDEKKVS